jgi:nicotinamidase-related amidase
MQSKPGLIFLFTLFLAIEAWAQEAPIKPEPKPVKLDSKTTAILVMDLHTRCHDPQQICSKLMPALGEFLEKARASSVSIVYTVSSEEKGKPSAEIATPLKRREGEPVIYPRGFDKFWGGELQDLLKPKGIKTVVLVGASAHTTVLHSATTAARIYSYNAIIPMDGTISRSNYELEYTFHHLSVIPGGANKLVQFTRLPMISFQ